MNTKTLESKIARKMSGIKSLLKQVDAARTRLDRVETPTIEDAAMLDHTRTNLQELGRMLRESHYHLDDAKMTARRLGL